MDVVTHAGTRHVTIRSLARDLRTDKSVEQVVRFLEKRRDPVGYSVVRVHLDGDVEPALPLVQAYAACVLVGGDDVLRLASEIESMILDGEVGRGDRHEDEDDAGVEATHVAITDGGRSSGFLVAMTRREPSYGEGNEDV